MPEQRIKKYVEVIADFLPDGTLTPQTVVWDTGQRFDITNISEILPRKYSKTGGVGVRYTCQIGRCSTYLWQHRIIPPKKKKTSSAQNKAKDVP